MRFCDFFIEYKIGLKGIKNLIPWTKLPMYRKVFMILTFVVMAAAILFILFKKYLVFLVCAGILIAFLLTFAIIDTRKSNLQDMLDNHYKKYSEERMKMLKELFNKYNLTINDATTIDLLIEEAENAKEENNPFLPIKRPVKILSTIIVPIIVYVANEIVSEMKTNELLYVALLSIVLILYIAAISFAVVPIFKDLIYRDSNKYDALIYDLRQLKIFEQ